MKNLLMSLMVLLPLISWSQEYAVTQSGDTIYIYMDGRWTYEPRSLEELEKEPKPEEPKWEIDTSFSLFYLSPIADKTINRPVDFYTISYLSKYWTRIPPAGVHPDADQAFSYKRDDVQAFLIADTAAMSLKYAVDTAMNKLMANENADIDITTTELRSVNDHEMVFVDYTVTAGESSFRFNTYFYAGDEGNIQFNVFTLEDDYQDNTLYIEELLNGLNIKKKDKQEKKTTVTSPKKKIPKKQKKNLDSIFNN